MIPRVLITGLDGFAGRHLATALADKGYEIFGLSRTTAGPVDRATSLQVDLRRLADTMAAINDIQPTHVVHLAGIAFVGHDDVEEIYTSNIMGARNLLTALKAQARRPEAVIVTSSANIYGNSDAERLGETDPPNPANDYAVSKLATEYVARLFQADLPVTIVRPFNYTGPGQSPLFVIPKIVAHFRSGASEIELGNLDVYRDFSDVRMVCDYLVRLIMEPRARGEVFNICTGRATSLRQVLESCEALTGRRIAVRVNPALVRTNEVRVLIGRPDKIQACVGQAQDYTLEDTLRWMIA